jgi:HlyD family secretion protein
MAKIFGRKIYFSAIIGAIGLAAGVVFTFTMGNPPPPAPNQLSLPPSTPYDNTVSGTGLVEANSRNIDVGSFVSGIVAELPVNEGDIIAKDDVLLVLDKKAAQAELQLREKDVESASARLKTAQNNLADEDDKLKRTMSLKAGIAVSESAQVRQKFASKRAGAQVEQARAELESSKAALNFAQVALDRHTIRSPIDGQVLKVRTRVGEFITAGSSTPLTLGNTSPLYLRVQIDENDLWRFSDKATAVAYLRSNKDRKYALTFVRTEPLVIAKRQLSGDTAEQVDTRIMEVLYSIEPAEGQPLFVGQQLDVFIEGANN